MPNVDLHCHSRLSDGLLEPAELVRRAAANGVDALALTDHDELGGLDEARTCATQIGLRFINGVEISVTWEGITIHIVGLQVDPDNATLRAGLTSIRKGRLARAGKIATGLGAAGIEGSLAGAQQYAKNSAILGRTHFARFLVSSGHAANVKDVFHRFLVKDKPGYVPHEWASLQDAVVWITGAGGTAVVAHPGRYSMPSGEQRRFFTQFREFGGTGVEVVTGSHSPEQYVQYAAIAREFGLLASRGSDFHGPGESRIELGKLPELPGHLKPVWHDWDMQ